MPTKLCRWGNSLGLRIPRTIADVARLKAGDQLVIRLLDSGDILVRAANPNAVDGPGACPSAALLPSLP